MMNHWSTLLLLAALPAAAPAPVAVQALNFDWSYLPPLKQLGADHLSTKAMARLYEIASEGRCQIPGYVRGRDRLDFKISFAAQFGPKGTLRRVVIPKLNCPEAEGILGGALLEMMKRGDYRPTGMNPDGWYVGNLAFGFDG
jgi:hypothetical protein